MSNKLAQFESDYLSSSQASSKNKKNQHNSKKLLKNYYRLVKIIQAVVSCPEGKSYILTSSFTGKFNSICLAVMKKIEASEDSKSKSSQPLEMKDHLLALI